MARARVAAYPGSFDPPTVAHLAIAEAAVEQLGVDRVDLVVSADPLGKDRAHQVRLTDRLTVLGAVATTRPWMGVATTERRLITDIADGYDAVVVGADKWAQVLDPVWYGGSVAARDRAVSGLGTVGLAPRAGVVGADRHLVERAAGVQVVDLDIHASHRIVSATSVRSGRREWIAAEAAAFDAQTGAWSDPDRYITWVAAMAGSAAGRDRGDHDR